MKNILKTCLLLIICLFINNLYSQDVEGLGGKRQGFINEYDRNSLTVVLIDNNCRYISDIAGAMERVGVPDKFDNNMLEKRVLRQKADKVSAEDLLRANKIPNDILAKWFSRDENGRFSMSVVHERGLYNATDADVIEASVSKIGLAKLEDAGEALVSRSYIMVLVPNSVKTMSEVYRERKEQGQLEGWQASVTGFLFKLSDVKNTMDNFYNEMWIFDEDSPEIQAQKRALFDESDFALKYVAQATVTANGTQNKSMPIYTRNQLFDMLVNNAINNLIVEYEGAVDELRVKTAIYDTRPITAKIGKKEGVGVDDRFFVYEYRMNNKNEVYADRRGVIRAKRVADNRSVAKGNKDEKAAVSKFYQVAGHKIEPGMVVEQNNDVGIGVTLGYGSGALSGAQIKIEVLTGSLAQLKVFCDAHISGGKYDMSGTESKLFQGEKWSDVGTLITGYGGGVSKGWFLTRNTSVSVHGQMGQESVSLFKVDFDDKVIKVVYFGAGAQLAVNLKYNLQLVGGATCFGFAKPYIKNKNDDDEDDEKKEPIDNANYGDLFVGRSGLNINLGLRIEF